MVDVCRPAAVGGNDRGQPNQPGAGRDRAHVPSGRLGAVFRGPCGIARGATRRGGGRCCHLARASPVARRVVPAVASMSYPRGRTGASGFEPGARAVSLPLMNDTGDLGPTSTPGIGKMGRVELREVSRHEAPDFRVVGRTTLTCSVTVSVERLACLPPGARPRGIGLAAERHAAPLGRSRHRAGDRAGTGITQDTLNAALGRPPGDPQTATTLVQLSAAD